MSLQLLLSSEIELIIFFGGRPSKNLISSETNQQPVLTPSAKPNRKHLENIDNIIKKKKSNKDKKDKENINIDNNTINDNEVLL